MGPGPSDVPPSVLEALARPTIGHLDPEFLAVMDDVRSMLRTLFGTTNALTIPMSGTGSAGMETCLVNLIEPGDRVVVGVNGVFGMRMVDVARRCGADVVPVEKAWGQPFHPDDFSGVQGSAAKLLCLVQAETSTGAWTDLTGFRSVADNMGALLLVDAVTSLGGKPVDLDRHGVDAVYSGTQKCLSCPPGLAPISFSERAGSVLESRKTPVQSWYLDLTMIGRYWGAERAYHHTAPINLVYALHQALRLALLEGLDNRYARHALHGSALVAGLEAMGLQLPVSADARMPQLTVVAAPAGVDEASIRRRLLSTHGIEIGGGLGVFKGKVWRIGLMGAAATRRNVTLCLSGLTQALRAEGFAAAGDGVEAAAGVYRSQQ